MNFDRYLFLAISMKILLYLVFIDIPDDNAAQTFCQIPYCAQS